METGAVAKAYDPRKEGARCDECPLKGSRVVPPSPAITKTKLVIVGEAPGRVEVAHGRSFIGPSGLLLDKILGELGFSRDFAHVTNSILCRPDEDDQLKAASVCCAPRLARELSVLPKTAPISALGAVATRVLLGQKSIFKARGFVWRVPALTKSKSKKGKKNESESAKR